MPPHEIDLAERRCRKAAARRFLPTEEHDDSAVQYAEIPVTFQGCSSYQGGQHKGDRNS